MYNLDMIISLGYRAKSKIDTNKNIHSVRRKSKN